MLFHGRNLNDVFRTPLIGIRTSGDKFLLFPLKKAQGVIIPSLGRHRHKINLEIILDILAYSMWPPVFPIHPR
jgi:hypothetical protein